MRKYRLIKEEKQMIRLNTTGKMTLWVMYAIAVIVHFNAKPGNSWVTFIVCTLMFLTAYYGTFQLNKEFTKHENNKS